MGGGGGESSKKRGESYRNRDDNVLLGISAVGSVSGGCDTLLGEIIASKKANKPKKSAVEIAASIRSKMNLLITILAVLFTQFLLCICAALIIILHHSRTIDWFPSLLEVTGKGYARTLTDSI